jgi:hypothetical protein
MNYKEYLNQLASKLKGMVELAPECQPLHTDDYGWENHRYESKHFRLAHVERYADGKIEVLHFTTFPHRWSPEPIFGFDVITTEKVITGAYMDLSPILKEYPFDEGMDIGGRKPIPEWATVFSDRFIMIKPESDAEFIRFCDWVVDKYDWYLNSLLSLETKTEDINGVTEKQNTYCQVQSSNPRTYSALKALIGGEEAQYFMENILFPQIET